MRDRYPGLERLHDAGERTVVSGRSRVLLTAVPHAGSTPLLHLVARGEGLFDESAPGATPALAVHEPDLWPPRLRWAEADDELRREASTSADWIRLTTTRDPGARLWAAWQATVLLREPETVVRFGDADWFPGEVHGVDGLVERFRAFVQALATDDLLFAAADWAPQTLLLQDLPALTHRIPLDRLDEAVRLLADRFDVATDGLPAADPSLLAHDPAVYDAATAAVVNRLYGPDFDELDHPRLPEVDAALPDEWRTRAEHLLPAIAALAERSAQHGELRRRCADAEAAVESERVRVVRLREQADERWDSQHTERAALVALNARIEVAEERLLDAHRELEDLRNRAGPQITARARGLARRVRDRMTTRGARR